MRKIFFALCAIVCTTALYAQKDWAKYYRYEEANAALDFRPIAVFMGDSITDRWYRFHSSFFEDNKFLGRGIGGQVTSQMLCRFRNDVIELNPQCVVILAGINDIAKNNGEISIENTFRNFVSMCELARANNIKVILCSTLPCNEVRWRPEVSPADEVIKLNQKLRSYADEKGITYVDYYSVLVNDNKGLSEVYSDDGCHPTMACYEVMENLILKTVSKVVKGRKR